ncbi:MAG: hypothetical protein JJ975_01615 [Bacteroidia bacterium]|nr:hypothetical protein [Bacteroidia bacterium]
MNTSKFKYLIALTLLLSVISSCKEDEEPLPEPETPVVMFNFADPAAGATYSAGDTVAINGMISFENDMHGYEISIINTSHSDTVVFNKHEHMDGKMFHIHEHWVNNVMHHSNMQLKIEALTDHAGTRETKTINFHCHPM